MLEIISRQIIQFQFSHFKYFQIFDLNLNLNANPTSHVLMFPLSRNCSCYVSYKSLASFTLFHDRLTIIKGYPKYQLNIDFCV
uniref:Ovule protein n=1 Tax=Heterorhabditis bacteriophora TaxID=37862 RepID=A0A1I7WUX1_HETBA